MEPIFFYGSLRDRTLLEVVLGRTVAPDAIVPAWVEDRAAFLLADEAYPALLQAPGRRAEGVALTDLAPGDLDRLAFFEEAEYGLAPITVMTGDGPLVARYFRGTEKPAVSDSLWDFDAWCRNDRLIAIEAAREYMSYLGRIPVEEIDRVWSGIMIRAYQRARALEEPARPQCLTRDDVRIDRLDRHPTRFLSIEEMRLAHRRFDGGWTEPLERSVVRWGDAVTLLPYDPRRDRVLLIEQFRPGPAARGDASPWCLEAIAGRLDANETPEATARREAREEAGLTIGRLAPIAGYYPTPGVAAEHLTGYVGEADLDGAGGHFGLADEGEDIRAMVLDFGAAMAAVEAGTVNTANGLVSLLWLALNRDRLRAEWAALETQPGSD